MGWDASIIDIIGFHVWALDKVDPNHMLGQYLYVLTEAESDPHVDAEELAEDIEEAVRILGEDNIKQLKALPCQDKLMHVSCEMGDNYIGWYTPLNGPPTVDEAAVKQLEAILKKMKLNPSRIEDNRVAIIS